MNDDDPDPVLKIIELLNGEKAKEYLSEDERAELIDLAKSQ
jgi:hypothetical protein